MKRVYIHRFMTEIGRFHLLETNLGLAMIDFFPGGATRLESILKKDFGGYEIIRGGAENRKAEQQIKAYLNRRLTKFQLHLDLSGTAFQRKVLRQIASIPFGKVKTYGQVARAVGHPRAARAVGTVNAKNRLPLVIPCHRVVAAKGPGGYRGGMKLKKALHRLENINDVI
jgi:methylated-DNA-[protein]-cysteine S-methyltransferase